MLEQKNLKKEFEGSFLFWLIKGKLSFWSRRLGLVNIQLNFIKTMHIFDDYKSAEKFLKTLFADNKVGQKKRHGVLYPLVVQEKI